MKQNLQISTCLVFSLILFSCQGMIDKAKAKAEKVIAEQVEKIKEEAAANAENTTTETDETVAVAEILETETAAKTAQTADAWWQHNFSITFDYTPAGLGASNISAGAMKQHVTLQRYGDVVRLTREMSGIKADFIYKLEDGAVVQYMFNPENKKAHRKPAGERSTIDGIVKSNLSEYAVLQTKDPEKQDGAKLADTENFAGRQCQKWVTEKNILGNITRSTILIDKEFRCAFKIDAYIKLGDNVQEGNLLTVTDFSTNPDSKEILIDLSNYEIIQ